MCYKPTVLAIISFFFGVLQEQVKAFEWSQSNKDTSKMQKYLKIIQSFQGKNYPFVRLAKVGNHAQWFLFKEHMTNATELTGKKTAWITAASVS